MAVIITTWRLLASEFVWQPRFIYYITGRCHLGSQDWATPPPLPSPSSLPLSPERRLCSLAYCSGLSRPSLPPSLSPPPPAQGGFPRYLFLLWLYLWTVEAIDGLFVCRVTKSWCSAVCGNNQTLSSPSISRCGVWNVY